MDSNEMTSPKRIAPSTVDFVVAVEVGSDGAGELYTREGDLVTKRQVAFRPFLLVSSPVLLNGCGAKFEIKELNGVDGVHRFLAEFPDEDSCDEAAKHLKKVTNRNPSSPDAPYRIFSDSQQQLLIANNVRLFQGMRFDQLRRMQFDIETLCAPGYDFPNPEREADRIVAISMSDTTGWEECLIGPDPADEKKLLESFVDAVRKRDPDVLEGHNIFRFDLPFIRARAKRHKVALKLGRDGSVARARNSRFTAGERTISYERFDVYARHVIDTYFLTQLYDVGNRELEDFGLKAVARHFKVAAPDRTYVDPSRIGELLAKDPARLKAYSLDDVRETRSISGILSPSFFYQAQILPFTYQNCVSRGNATRIDALLVAAYLAKGESLPIQEPPRSFSGALVEALESGLFENVWHCDVRSLYPSIILAEKWRPSRDRAGLFPLFLDELRTFRLRAKDCARSAASAADRDYFNSLQTTYKVLINSFYGYLGFSQGTFNDYDMAERVTAKGREILSGMLDFLRSSGAKVIEMDTDGIYFQPPASVGSPKEMEAMIQKTLPPGIDVELDDVFSRMFCYKSKNYAVIDDKGEISITGAALKSRGLEPFLRDYYREVLGLMLKGEAVKVPEITSRVQRALEERKLPFAKLAKSETLSESPESYSRKLKEGSGRRSAAYELALKSGRVYRQGDQVAFYVTGTRKKVSVVENSKLLADATDIRDENIEYYIAKLDEAYGRFKDFVPGDQSQQTLLL